MEIRQLKYFVAVADMGSISKASKACYLTQSAISQQMKALEEELKASLFVRTQHSIVLTEAGESLLPYARKIIKETEMAREVVSMNGAIEGTLNIGVGAFIEPYIRKAACKFIKQYPNVMLNITYNRAQHLNAMLRAHELDVAFTMNTAYQDEGIDSEAVIPFHLSVIMKKGHPLEKVKNITIEHLKQYKTIFPDAGKRPMETIYKYCEFNVTALNTNVVVNDADAALNLVEETNYITFLPCMYVRNRGNLVARPIEGLSAKLMSNAHWMRDVYRKRAAVRFVEIVKEEAVPWCVAME